jgi:ATP-binding cassette subfamily C protein CydCD
VRPIDPRLLRYSRSSRGFIFATVSLAILSAIATIAQAYFLALLVVRFFQSRDTFFENRGAVILLACIFLLRAVIIFVIERIAASASSKMRGELRQQVMVKTLDSGGTDIQELGSAGLSILVTKGINDLDAYFSKFLPQLFIASIVPFAVGVTVATQDWLSGVIILFTIPLIPIFGILIGKFTSTATAKKWQTLGLLSTFFHDLMSGLTTLKVYGREKIQGEKLKNVGEDYRRETMGVLRISFLSSLALELVATLSVALLAVSIGLRLVNGTIGLQTGLFILIIAPEVYWPIRQVAGYFHAAADGVAAFEKLFKILDRPETKTGESFRKITAVTWSELTVDFPDRTSIQIPCGQITSEKVHLLIGPSGAGKSTLANILLGFIKPTSGEVIISTDVGDIPISQISITNLREKISWLPQEPRFPIGSVAQILRHAKPDATDFELVEILEKVNLDILDLADGLSTQLGTLKQPLSIGQLRKIALARALLKPHQLLILDEPTASVDDVSEKIILQILEKCAAEGSLVLLITHRVSMITGATNITDLVHHK